MKTIIIVSLSMLLISCSKDDVQTNNNTNTGCNCGTIVDDGIDSAISCYWLKIENDCTGNQKKFCFDQLIWQTNYVGDYFCVSNVTSW